MSKRHDKPCYECIWLEIARLNEFGDQAMICQRPVKARSCPVVGLDIVRLGRNAYQERRRNKSLFLRRPQCGDAGQFFRKRR